jgi:mRNA-degrading endonuclease RelE of RelBE toxin-antitoxin system
MKTTIQIPDTLLEEAKQLAAREQTTFKALVEEGLRRIIDDHRRAGKFRLRKASFKGKGIQQDLTGASWDQIRELTYRGRGG